MLVSLNRLLGLNQNCRNHQSLTEYCLLLQRKMLPSTAPCLMLSVDGLEPLREGLNHSSVEAANLVGHEVRRC